MADAPDGAGSEEAAAGSASPPAPAASPAPASSASGARASKKPTEPRPVPWYTKARRGLALLVVLVAVIGFVVLRASDGWKSCSTDTTTGEGSTYTTESCDELSLTTLVPVLLLVVALMWPDIAEVELFGLGSVKRRLNEQEGRQNELEAAQQRLENRIEATFQVLQNPVVNQNPVIQNFATDPRVTHLVEALADRRSVVAWEGTVTRGEAVDMSSGQDLRAHLEDRGRQLKPWLNLARRMMNDPEFAAVVREGAAAGTPADDPRLAPGDAELLRGVQRPGHPFNVQELERWAQENALQLDAVRDTLHAGDNATPEAVRVAAKFADQLFSDLQRRGLVATS